MIHSNKLYCGLLGDEQSSSFSLARSDWFKLVLAIGLVRLLACSFVWQHFPEKHSEETGN